MENTPLPARRSDRGRRYMWPSMRTSRPSAPGIMPAGRNGGELSARSLFRWRFGWHMLRWVERRHCPPVIRGGFMKVRLTVPVASCPAPIRPGQTRSALTRPGGPRRPPGGPRGRGGRPAGGHGRRLHAAADRPPRRRRPSSRRARTSRPAAPPPAGRCERPRPRRAAPAGARRPPSRPYAHVKRQGDLDRQGDDDRQADRDRHADQPPDRDRHADHAGRPRPRPRRRRPTPRATHHPTRRAHPVLPVGAPADRRRRHGRPAGRHACSASAARRSWPASAASPTAGA